MSFGGHPTATVWGAVSWGAVGEAVLVVDFVVAGGNNPLVKHRKRVLLDYWYYPEPDIEGLALLVLDDYILVNEFEVGPSIRSRFSGETCLNLTDRHLRPLKSPQPLKRLESLLKSLEALHLTCTFVQVKLLDHITFLANNFLTYRGHRVLTL